LRLRSNPAYNIATGLPSSFEDARSITPREALLHGIPYHVGGRSSVVSLDDKIAPFLVWVFQSVFHN
jgi:hypothetical protein